MIETKQKTKGEKYIPLQSKNKEEKIKENLANMKGFFTKNEGQLENDDIYFTYSSQDNTFGFCESSVLIKLSKKSDDNTTKSSIIKLKFENSNSVKPVGVEELPHKTNYFLGNDPIKWKTDIPNYEKIIYKNLYPKIDLIYYFNQNGLKYDWLVKPNADPTKIIEKFRGAESLSLDSKGGLIIKTKNGELREEKPFGYQKINDNMNEIDMNFKVLGNRLIYEIGNYDLSKELIIDPLIYSTFVGGGIYDEGWNIALDSEKNVYVTGDTHSSDFPTTIDCFDDSHNGGWSDVFVFKLKNDGSDLIYSTFVGGGGYDVGYSIALDSQDYVYVTGRTKSSDFPTTSGSFDESCNGDWDVFVFKLKNDGPGLVYSTFVGGGGSDSGYSIALDSDKNVYVTGRTRSSDFPTTSGCFDESYNGDGDVFVFKLKNDGSGLVYSTFVGGGSGDYGRSIALDSETNVYVTGYTLSSNFPTTSGCFDDSHNGGWDIFVFKLKNDGSDLIYSTFVGGGDSDSGESIALDSEDNVYVTGFTYSSDFPTTIDCFDDSHNGGGDVFVFKLKNDGSDLIYSTFVGGGDEDWGNSIALDSEDNVYVTGFTYSSDFPTTIDCFDDSHNGGGDVFVFKLKNDGSDLIYSTFVGGGDFDSGLSIALDSDKNVYMTGETLSSDFPTTIGCFDDSHNGYSDVFVFKIDCNNFPTADDLSYSDTQVFRTNSITLFADGSDLENDESDLTPTFEYKSPNGDWENNWISNINYNSTTEQWEAAFTPQKDAELGLYDFRVKFKDLDGGESDWLTETAQVEVRNNPPTASIDSISPNPQVEGKTITFTGSGVDDSSISSYKWHSDKDGDLSEKKSFEKSDLSIGTHTIYFKVQDNEGVWSDEVSKKLTINSKTKDTDGDGIPDSKDNDDGFNVFLIIPIIGIIVVIGIIGFFMHRKKSSFPKNPSTSQQQYQPQQVQQFPSQPSPFQQPMQPTIQICPYCNAQVPCEFRFCNMCGKQIKN